MDVSVVVLSCDKYERTWAPFWHFFRRAWPDCPWDVRLVTETATPRLDGCDVMPIGGGLSWGEQVARAMAAMSSDIVLVLLDDYFMTAPPDMGVLGRCLAWFEQDRVVYCRAVPTPAGDVPWADGFTLHPIQQPYRCSLQPAFWRRPYLAELASRVGSPWDFELAQNGEAERIHLSVDRATRPMSYINAVRNGIWQPEAIEMCRVAGC